MVAQAQPLDETIRSSAAGSSRVLGLSRAPWGKSFGVAQGSIREAINILAQEGFVAKASPHIPPQFTTQTPRSSPQFP
jgi:hypothetical protein